MDFFSELISWTEEHKPSKQLLAKKKLQLCKKYKRREIPTDVEIYLNTPKGQVGAGKETDAEAGYVPLRQGAGAANRRGHAIGREAIPVVRARLQALAIQVMLDRPVAAGLGPQALAGADDGLERGVPGDLQIDQDVAVARRLGRDPGPEDHGGLGRIAAGHAVFKGDRAFVDVQGLGRDRAASAGRATQAQKRKSLPTIDFHCMIPLIHGAALASRALAPQHNRKMTDVQ